MDLSVAAARHRAVSWRTGPLLCLVGAVTILAGCLLPHFRIHGDMRTSRGVTQSVTFDGLTVVPRALILVAVLAAVMAAASFGTGRRLRGGWVVVIIGGLLVCAREVVALAMPTEPLMSAMVQNGIDETVARDLIDRGLYSLDTMIGVWFILAGAILTVGGSVLAIRDQRFRRCELCRAVVRVDSYRDHLNAEHPTGAEVP
jgi:hypothetical protein